MYSGTILIIDDDVRNIFALSATLQVRGFTCHTAVSARQGIALLEAHPNIDIVLLDMMMPEMDGYEAIPLLKACSAAPVIAVTAQAMIGDREKCLAAGADNYVSKPIDVDKLMLVLSAHIKQVD
ncbi:MAG: response regulator [Chitinophagaceae bacterium]